MSKTEIELMYKDITDNNAEYECKCIKGCEINRFQNPSEYMCKMIRNCKGYDWHPFNIGDEVYSFCEYRKKESKTNCENN